MPRTIGCCDGRLPGRGSSVGRARTVLAMLGGSQESLLLRLLAKKGKGARGASAAIAGAAPRGAAAGDGAPVGMVVGVVMAPTGDRNRCGGGGYDGAGGCT